MSDLGEGRQRLTQEVLFPHLLRSFFTAFLFLRGTCHKLDQCSECVRMALDS